MVGPSLYFILFYFNRLSDRQREGFDLESHDPTSLLLDALQRVALERHRLTGQWGTVSMNAHELYLIRVNYFLLHL